MKKLYLITSCFAAVILTGCRTNKDILNDYEKDILIGDYEHASIEVSEKAQEESGDQLLWQLSAAGANHLSGNSEKAIEQFDAAEDVFAKNDAESVFSQGASGTCAMMTNDRAFPFAGGGQDRIFTCLYKAIDYAAAKNTDAARTELNRAAQHQENWIFERRKDIEAAREKMKEDAEAYAKENESENKDCGDSVNKAFSDSAFTAAIKEKTGFDPSVDGNLETLSQKDYLNGYAQHVCGVFRWITDGDGYDFFKGLPEICASNEMVMVDCHEAKNRVKPNNQVWIYIEDGLAPCREEWRLDLPLAFIPFAGKYVLYAGMALPYLRYRDPASTAYTVNAAGVSKQMEVLQDMDRLEKVEHDVYLKGALTREITRVIVKVGAQVALGVAYDACDNQYAKLGIKASQVAVAAYAASVTQADLRNWTAKPKRIFAVRITRPDDGKIVISSDAGNVAEIQLPEGNSMVFVNKPSMQAKPSVKVATF